jgi:hypothetical protein
VSRHGAVVLGVASSCFLAAISAPDAPLTSGRRTEQDLGLASSCDPEVSRHGPVCLEVASSRVLAAICVPDAPLTNGQHTERTLQFADRRPPGFRCSAHGQLHTGPAAESQVSRLELQSSDLGNQYTQHALQSQARERGSSEHGARELAELMQQIRFEEEGLEEEHKACERKGSLAESHGHELEQRVSELRAERGRLQAEGRSQPESSSSREAHLRE